MKVVTGPDQWAAVGRELRSLADSLRPQTETETVTETATGIHYGTLSSLVLMAFLRNISNKIFTHLSNKIME